MKNKIMVSLILIFLLAISASAVSANEDLDDAISETSDDNTDIELSNEDTIVDTISETDTENPDEETEINDNVKDEGLLGDNVESYNDVKVNNIDAFEKYVGTGNTYGDGTRFILNDSVTLNLAHTQNIKVSCIIEGGTLYGDVNNFFTVESPANGGPSSVTIRNAKFIITKANQAVLLAKGVTQGFNSIVNVAGITLENITILQDMGYNTNATLLNIENSPINTYTSNAINITGNTLNGAKALKFNNIQLTHDGFNGEEIYLPANEIIFQKDTKIVLNSDVVYQYAVDKSVGDPSFNFQLVLVDEDYNPLPNKTITFALSQKTYTAVTDNDGIATLKLSLSKAITYEIYSVFEGDERYKGSEMVANTITLTKKVSYLTVKNVSYKVTATKKLSATFKDMYGNLIKNKTVKFTVNGKTYSAKTNSKGVATAKITLNKKGTYTYTAKFAGDGTYAAVTKKAKLTVKPLATALSTKKYTFKKSATKKLSTTLKSGKTVLKGKKVSFKVNGKTYTTKTNSKGIATVKVKLSKKATYKYTVKFAGDNKYKAISKTNKVVVK